MEILESIIENLCIKEGKFKVPESFDYQVARKLLKGECNQEKYEIKILILRGIQK